VCLFVAEIINIFSYNNKTEVMNLAITYKCVEHFFILVALLSVYNCFSKIVVQKQESLMIKYFWLQQAYNYDDRSSDHIIINSFIRILIIALYK